MTALQKLKNFVDRDLKLLGYEHKIIIDKINSLLGIEKQNIILAYRIGYKDAANDCYLGIEKSDVYKQGLAYFEQTFKENEN